MGYGSGGTGSTRRRSPRWTRRCRGDRAHQEAFDFETSREVLDELVRQLFEKETSQGTVAKIFEPLAGRTSGVDQFGHRKPSTVPRSIRGVRLRSSRLRYR